MLQLDCLGSPVASPAASPGLGGEMLADIVDRRVGQTAVRGVDIIGVTIHRFGVPGISDARAIAQWYRAQGLGAMPYSFVVLSDGSVEQALSAYDPGPHAMRWSSRTIGVACIGDFTVRAPAPVQWDAAVDLVAMMLIALVRVVNPESLAGHTERPKATRYEDKECPGRLWPMGDFRADVARVMASIGANMLAERTVRR